MKSDKGEPMNTTQSKQLIAAARMAIEVLPRCDARIQLAKALNALRAPAPKAGKHIRQCFLCADTSRDASSVWTIPAGPHKYAFKPAHVDCVVRGDREVTEFFARIDARRGAIPAFDKTAAETCACGHQASSHSKDHLENLLACNHVDYPFADNGERLPSKPCDCDHFHYSIQDETLSAAAGN